LTDVHHPTFCLLRSLCLPGRHTNYRSTWPGGFEGTMGDLKPAILATNLVLASLTLAAITCRVGRRVFLVRSFSWHDGKPQFTQASGNRRLQDSALITLAAISASIFSILQMVSTQFGLGVPNVEVSNSNMRTLLKVLRSSTYYPHKVTDV
jgi:hypothetical protein